MVYFAKYIQAYKIYSSIMGAIKHFLILIVIIFMSNALYGQEVYKVTVSVLNVRDLPSTNNSIIIGQVRLNDTINVISIENNWAKFYYKSSEAYVSKKYLEKIELYSENSTHIDSAHIDTIQDTNIKNSTIKSRFLNNVNKYLSYRIIPSISFGISNFSVKHISAKPILNFGADLALQAIINDDVIFLPKDYFVEASFGYSLKGSRSIPLHYFDLILSPAGYRYYYQDYILSGTLGCYLGFSPSKVRTYTHSFNTYSDIGIFWKLGIEYLKFDKLFISISGKHGLNQVCDSNLKMKNISIQINISYNLGYINN